MRDSVRWHLTRGRLLPWITLVTAIVSFNNWTLSLFFPASILLKGADISELSALDQPHQVWFRTLDILAGGLLVIFVLLAWTRRLEQSKAYWTLLIATTVMGVANIFDALDPLRCSWTAEKACVVEASISRQGINFPDHAYSSIVIAICFIILPLTGLFIGKALHSLSLQISSLVVVAVQLEANLSIVYEFLFRQSYIEPTWGVNQELQMLFLSGWLIVLGSTLLGKIPRPS